MCCVQGLQSPHILTDAWHFLFCITATLVSSRWHLSVVLMCTSLTKGDTEHLLVDFLAIGISSLEKHQFSPFAYFLPGLCVLSCCWILRDNIFPMVLQIYTSAFTVCEGDALGRWKHPHYKFESLWNMDLQPHLCCPTRGAASHLCALVQTWGLMGPRMCVQKFLMPCLVRGKYLINFSMT